MDWTSLLNEHALALIPVLMIVGHLFKEIPAIGNRWIPLLLLPFGIAGAVLSFGWSVDALIQGVLACGAAVYGDQLKKQLFETEDA